MNNFFGWYTCDTQKILVTHRWYIKIFNVITRYTFVSLKNWWYTVRDYHHIWFTNKQISWWSFHWQMQNKNNDRFSSIPKRSHLATLELHALCLTNFNHVWKFVPFWCEKWSAKKPGGLVEDEAQEKLESPGAVPKKNWLKYVSGIAIEKSNSSDDPKLSDVEETCRKLLTFKIPCTALDWSKGFNFEKIIKNWHWGGSE